MTALEVTNPVTGKLVGTVPRAAPDDFGRVIGAAREAQRQWAAKPFKDRAAIVRRFHDLLLDACDHVLDVIQCETGKARRDAFCEVVTVAGTARYYLQQGAAHVSSKHGGAPVPVITRAEVIYKPYPVVGLISPWNYPFLLSIGDAIPALLAGSAVVVKPSELTPLSARLARDLMVNAGLNPALLTMLYGAGDVGAELIRHVDYIGFTGGITTGRNVAIAAAERLVPFSLELGGKNPMIVLEGAQLDNAAAGLITGAFANTGQTCIAVERVYVQDSIFEDFMRRVKDKVASLRIGSSNGWDVDIGSLIGVAHADKVMRHIDEARKMGAKTLAGGNRRLDLGPAFVEPTILAEVPGCASVRREETFGPVVSVYPVRNVDDAIREANATEFGLNASIWTGDARHSRTVARSLETGSAVINSTLLIYNSFDVPMGGVKSSGIGRRHGEHGILRYMQAQSIVSSIASHGGYDGLLAYLDRPSRAKAFVNILRLWRTLGLAL